MYCERCKKLEATIHLTEIIKDVKSELHLCENCARDIGLNSKLSNFSLSIPEMLSFLDINEMEDYPDGAACASCGVTFMDYSREGRLGCPDCYDSLGHSLVSVIAGYHGATMHTGKHPDNRDTTSPGAATGTTRAISLKKTSEEYRRMLEGAVIEERYEEAAVLRDRIRDLESRDKRKG